jgi:hypothetical protein
MRNYFLLIFTSLLFHSCSGQFTDTKTKIKMNKLKYSSSPYLQQHANNPVNWQEWGEEALKQAKDENKPLIISIGYAACHWCHVMEYESFSDDEVAAFMNENFVCLKVDREERPDVDRIYMDAVQLISGQGGWPLNAFAMPDGKPFFAGTYFNKAKWMDMLSEISNLYQNEHEKVVENANQLTLGLNSNQLDVDKLNEENDFSKDDYLLIFSKWKSQIDYSKGGFKRAPKFPLPISWEFLLQYYYLSGNRDALQAVKITLDEMAKGGIYDQIGGGFARYSVDEYWKVPHFEKMLYDNAQLVSLYSHAFQITKKERYAEVIRKSLVFVERELTDKNGGFYSSLNADSEGEEGKYYVWTQAEFFAALDDEFHNLIGDYYQISEKGNWEHNKNILLPKYDKEKFSDKNNISLEQFNIVLQTADQQLLNFREKREKPSTDNKILSSWNALMLKAYLDAFRAVGDKKYLNIALKNARFIEENMLENDGSLLRNYMNGKASISAFLDDYSLLASAYLELYSITFDKHWLELSKSLTDYCIAHFLDSESAMFFYTSDISEALVARKFELTDNVIASSNSILASVLFKLSHYLNDENYLNISKQMLINVINEVRKSGPWYANWSLLNGMLNFGVNEVVLMGDKAVEKNHQMQLEYLPTSLFLGGEMENLPLLENRLVNGQTLIYVCRNKTCKLPVSNVEDALKQFKIIH